MNFTNHLRHHFSCTHLSSLPQLVRFSQHLSSTPTRLRPGTRTKSLDKALRVLDLISPKKSKATHSQNRQNHLRLIEDSLQTLRKQSIGNPFPNDFITSSSSNTRKKPLDKVHISYSFKEGDSISLLRELHREGLIFDAAVASHALSACGNTRSLNYGVQLHCLAIRNGVSTNVYVGSSLISFYIKCGALNFACKVFEEMPERNVVSWTTLISGFAQEWRIDECMKIYNWMRNFNQKPNHFTFTTLLSACMGTGSLTKGRSVHCQAITFGFHSYVHSANALISMYCKCGNVVDAYCIFDGMLNKDVVSWNSMIAGYALHGLGVEAIYLFEEMRKQENVKPDAITFLGVLSSCRHAGFVDQGRAYFRSMVEEYGLEPELDHYSCVVDLLGRAGLLEDARDFILEMPVEPNAVIWSTFLSSCRLHRDVWIGIEAAEKRLEIEPSCATTHSHLAQLYAMAGMWNRAADVRKMMRDREIKCNPGCTWIEIENVVHQFRAEDALNVRAGDILRMLDILVDQMDVVDDLPEFPEEMKGDLSAPL